MRVSRSSFLKICGAAALGQGVDVRAWLTGVTGPLAHIAALVTEPSSGQFRLQDACATLFRRHVNTSFTVRLGDVPVRLILTRVIDGPRSAEIEQFSLIFHGPAGAAVAHATHAVHHPELGAFDLFIAPVGGSNARCTVYEACFSRHVSRRFARLEGGSWRRKSL